MLTYLLAVLAACANATSSVLQRKANRQVPREQNLSLRLIWSLLHEPVWFGGVLAVIAGFLFQATALGTGPIAIVEPLLVLELPATLILASRVFGSRMHWREWTAIVAITGALAGLIFALSPSGGKSAEVRWYVWLIGVAVNVGLVAALVVAGRRAGRRSNADSAGNPHQAALLGVAAGATFGLTAALMKGMTDVYARGFAALFTSWQLYAMIAAGAAGLFLLQSAVNAGRLLAAQPGLTMADPIVSVLWGVVIFHEQVRSGWYAILAALTGLAMAAAVVFLARSPLLSGEGSPRSDSPSGHGAATGAGQAGDRPDRRSVRTNRQPPRLRDQ